MHDRKMKEKLLKLAKDLYHKQRRKDDKIEKGTKIHFVQKCVTEMLRNTHTHHHEKTRQTFCDLKRYLPRAFPR